MPPTAISSRKIIFAIIFSVIVNIVIPLSFSLLFQRNNIVSVVGTTDERVSVKRDVDSIYVDNIADSKLYSKQTNYIDNRDFEAYEGNYGLGGDVFVIYPINESAYLGKAQEEIGKSIYYLYDRMEVVNISNQKVKIEKQGSTLSPPGIASDTTVMWPIKNNEWVRIKISTQSKYITNESGSHEMRIEELSDSQINFVSYFLDHLPSELK